MTAWEGAALLATLLGLSIAVAALIAREPRITSTDDTAPTGVEYRLCATASCPFETLHLVLPCGAALCAGCGHENPATARARRAP